MKIQVKKKDYLKIFDYETLPRLCLELAGGGYSEAHTLKALAIKAQFERTGKVKTRGFSMVLIQD